MSESLADFARRNRSSDLVVTRRGETLVDERWAPRRDVASAQKSIVAVLVGIAIGRGQLRLSDTVSSYLGDGWTGHDVPTERDITVEHLMSMTSGLGDAMEFVAKPGERWDYSLIVYPQTKPVLEAAVGRTLRDMTAEWLTGPLGMTESAWEDRVWDGTLPDGWKPAFFYPNGRPMEAFVSTARDMAIFGNAVMGGCAGLGVDEEFRQRMTRSSQALNPAYGLLWWVNESSFSYAPKATRPVDGPFMPGLPADAFAALGAGEQCCVVIPSAEMVIARTGEQSTDGDLAGGSFVRDLAVRALNELGGE